MKKAHSSPSLSYMCRVPLRQSIIMSRFPKLVADQQSWPLSWPTFCIVMSLKKTERFGRTLISSCATSFSPCQMCRIGTWPLSSAVWVSCVQMSQTIYIVICHHIGSHCVCRKEKMRNKCPIQKRPHLCTQDTHFSCVCSAFKPRERRNQGQALTWP